MFHPMKFLNSLIYLNLILLMACSGGTGGTGVTSGGGNNVVVGTITQVNTASAAGTQTAGIQQVTSVAAAGGNSVTINGIQFDISSSTITLDGLDGTEADLRVGMVATIKGSVNAGGTMGIADFLSVKEVIKGLVENLDTANNTITVLGQTVQASAATHWDNVTDINSININDIVEVSGYVKNNNVIAATRVELLPVNETEFKVTGSISSLPTATTFDLGSLSVDYSNAVLIDIPNNVLTNGMYVEVKGTLVNSQLMATQVSAEKLEVSDAESMELQGFVTSVTSGTSFSVNHQAVQIDGNTQYNGGSSADIVAGVLVSVSGPLVDGVLIANLVSFEDSVKITAVIDTVSTNLFTLTGFGNLNISADASTEFDDTVSGIPDLAAGDTVTIHGNLIPATGNVFATRITLESTSPSTNVSLQGPIDMISPDQNNVTILGIDINTASFQDNSFVVEGAMSNSRNYFFSMVSTGAVVMAQGFLDVNGGFVAWQSLLYEPSNN